MSKETRNQIKGLCGMSCPKCGCPMPMFMSKCPADDCDYED